MSETVTRPTVDPRLSDGDHERFYRQLAARAAAAPGYRNQVIFELQTVDWRNDTPIPAEELTRTMRWLQSMGVRHLAYYPDDFVMGQPALRELRKGISLAVFPLGLPQ